MILSKITSVAHVCEVGAYKTIFQHGLRPAREICADFGCSPEAQRAHLRLPRTAAVPHGPHPEEGCARLADNLPLLDPAWQGYLRKSLAGSNCTLEEYCALLNQRSYFWAAFEFKNGAVAGKAAGYTNNVTAGGPFEVIRLPFASLKRLVSDQGLAIELTDLNSGSAPHSITRRGPDTWTPLAHYPQHREVREVTVIGRLCGLADTAEVLHVEDGRSKLIWMRGPR